MRRQICALIPRKANICIFCSLRNSSEVATGTLANSTRRAYHSSRTSRAGSNATAPARQYEDDDDDGGFAMLKNSAAKSAPPLKTSGIQPLRVDLPSSSRTPSRQLRQTVGFPEASRSHQQTIDSRQSSSQDNYRNRYGGYADRGYRNGEQKDQNRQRQTDFRTSSSREQSLAQGTGQQTQADRSYRNYEQRDSFKQRRSEFKPSHGSARGTRQDQNDADGGFRGHRQQDRFSMGRSGFGSFSSRESDPTLRVKHEEASATRPRFSRDNTQNTGYSQREPEERRRPAERIWTPPAQVGEPGKESLATYSPLRPVEAPEAAEQSSDFPDFNISMSEDALELDRKRRRRDVAVEQPTSASSSSSRFRFSSRFEPDEEEVQPQAQRQARPRVRTADFDFELYEAELALSGKRKKEKKVKVQPTKPTLHIPEFMTVQQLAQALKIQQEDLLKKLEEEGFEGARYDHLLDAETSAIFADIYGFEPVALEEEMQDLVARPPPEDVSVLPERPPIVTIMGHVDHGKTTLLDWLRKSSVAAGEHGGITQHIGAFSVVMPGTEKRITFLDTPGHEAFLDMRRRGANVTDIVVLVVAADDSVKPQTVEAIKHALDAGVQIIVAINKVDKHDANIEQVKQDLTRHEIVVEDYGGDFQAIPVSGKTGQGMDQLEEAIITLADVLDLRAERDIPAEGQIIESKVTNAGRVATVLVRRGTLRVGDFIVAGPTWGRVRTLRNDTGQLVEAAYPGDPVQVDGWRGADPTAGLEVLQADNEQQAKDVVELRIEKIRSMQSLTEVTSLNATKAQEAEARAKVLEWERENNIKRRQRDNEGWVDTEKHSGPKEVFFVVKADVAGSVEAIVAAVSAVGNNEIRANVVHSGTGPLNESDIRLLATSGQGSYAISFNQPIESAMHNLAEAAKVQILDYNVIYKVTDAVKERLSAALPPIFTQRVVGEAEIGQIFEITVKKQKIKIAGCKITNGIINRDNKVRVIRNGETVYTGTISSLKNVKKDVTEMRKGECGLGFAEWEGAEAGDQVQCFEEKEEKRTLY